MKKTLFFTLTHFQSKKSPNKNRKKSSLLTLNTKYTKLIYVTFYDDAVYIKNNILTEILKYDLKT